MSPHTDHPTLGPIYQEIQRSFENFFPTQEEEGRQDSYFVTHYAFGIKYRHGKKLEIKIRAQKKDSFGIEIWKKYKLGKDEVGEQIDRILTLLAQEGYTTEELKQFEAQILQRKTMEVHKSRKIAVINDVTVEYCDIIISNRAWISVAVESHSRDAITQFITTHPVMRHLFSGASQYYNNYKQSEDGRSPCPVLVCGYPFIVKFMDNDFSTEELAEAIQPLREILTAKGLPPLL